MITRHLIKLILATVLDIDITEHFQEEHTIQDNSLMGEVLMN